MNLKFPYRTVPVYLRFIITGLILYIAWVFIYEGFIKPRNMIDPWLTRVVSSHSVGVLRLFGYAANDKITDSGTIIYNGQNGVLQIAYFCDGLILYVVFLVFMLAFPGPLKHKCWYILVGIILIYIINLARVVSLVLIQIHSPSYLAFNHKYTFTMLVYGCIFLLWLFWVNLFSAIPKSTK